jgi:hypothetical protein
MRTLTLILFFLLTVTAFAADVESRRLTHYLPQDFLDTVVRTESWTEVTLNVKGGVLKDDTIRIWAGGVIDRGNGDQPGEIVAGAVGVEARLAPPDPSRLVLSTNPAHAYAILFKTESAGPVVPMPPGKPLEIKLASNGEKLWIGFNDEKGRFNDNHIGKGRRHELDPLWIRIEVVRIVVD